LTAADGVRLADALRELYVLTPVEEFPARVLKLAQHLIACDKADYTDVDFTSGDVRVLVDPVPDVLAELEPARVAFMHQHPVLEHFARTRDTRSRAIADFLRVSDFHRLDLYNEFFRYVGVEAQLTVTISSGDPLRAAGISLDRGSGGFQDRERLLLEVLRPHLCVAFDNAMRYTEALRTSLTPSGVASSFGLDRLTDRELEVLGLLSTGLTNTEIAASLGISAGTVRKHLEHILQRLDVRTRTAAAACYLSATRASNAPPPRWTASVSGVPTARTSSPNAG